MKKRLLLLLLPALTLVLEALPYGAEIGRASCRERV